MKETKHIIPFEDSLEYSESPIFVNAKKVETIEEKEIAENYIERRFTLSKYEEEKIREKIYCVHDIAEGQVYKYPFHKIYEVLSKHFKGRTPFWTYKKAPKEIKYFFEVIDNMLVYRFFIWDKRYFKEGVKQGLYESFRVIFDKDGVYKENRDSIAIFDTTTVNYFSKFWGSATTLDDSTCFSWNSLNKQVDLKEIFGEKLNSILYYVGQDSNSIGHFRILCDSYSKLYLTENVFKNTPKDILKHLDEPFVIDETRCSYRDGYVQVETNKDFCCFHVIVKNIEIERIYIKNGKIYKFGYNLFKNKFVSTKREKMFAMKTDIINCNELPSKYKDINFRYISDNLKFILYAEKYPILEQLAKVGMYAVVNGVLLNSKTVPSFVKEYKSIKKMLKVKKITESICDLGYMEMLSCLELAYTGADINKRINIARYYSYEVIKQIVDTYKANNKNPMHFFNALDLHQKGSKRVLAHSYVDYLKFRKEANEYRGYEYYPEIIKVSDIQYKHDLAYKEHIAQSEASYYKAYDAKFKEKIKSKEYTNFLYENDEFTIKIPESYLDLKMEGFKLNHCVATYYSSVAKGNCNILFLREKNHEDIPFMTIELRKNSFDSSSYIMSQCKGRNNTNTINNNLSEFLKKWKEEKNIIEDYERNYIDDVEYDDDYFSGESDYAPALVRNPNNYNDNDDDDEDVWF